LTHPAQEDAPGHCLSLFGADDFCHGRFDRAWRNSIYADTEATHLVRQIARERHDSSLGRRVRNMRDP
jgi:hypothetical protein